MSDHYKSLSLEEKIAIQKGYVLGKLRKPGLMDYIITLIHLAGKQNCQQKQMCETKKHAMLIQMIYNVFLAILRPSEIIKLPDGFRMKYIQMDLISQPYQKLMIIRKSRAIVKKVNKIFETYQHRGYHPACLAAGIRKLNPYRRLIYLANDLYHYLERYDALEYKIKSGKLEPGKFDERTSKRPVKVIIKRKKKIS